MPAAGMQNGSPVSNRRARLQRVVGDPRARPRHAPPRRRKKYKGIGIANLVPD